MARSRSCSAFGALLWILQLINATNDYSLNRAAGLRPREASGLWGVFASPFLHHSYYHLFSNTVPLVLIGWVLLLSGVRAWLTVTAIVVVVGGLASWAARAGGLDRRRERAGARLARLPALARVLLAQREVDRRRRAGAVLLRHAARHPAARSGARRVVDRARRATSLPASSPARCCTRARDVSARTGASVRPGRRSAARILTGVDQRRSWMPRSA